MVTAKKAGANNIAIPPIAIPVSDTISLLRYDLISPDEKYALIQDNRQFWGESFEWVKTAGKRSTRLEHASTILGVKEGSQAPYGIYVNDMFAGRVTLQERDETSAFLGYQLSRRFLRQGVTTQAARSLVEFGFDEWGLNEVNLVIKPDNARSIATARKLGAKSIGLVQKKDSRGWIRTYTGWRIEKDA